MVKYTIPELSAMPRKDYREACHFSGDVREVAKRLGTVPLELRNDLGFYLAVPLIADGIALKLIGLVPFIETSFTVVADPLDRSAARRAIKALLGQIDYVAPEYEDKHLPEVPD